MFQRLSIIEKTTVFLASLCVAVFGVLACLRLRVDPTYSDFVVGNITWRANTKLQDLIAAPAFILIITACFWFYTRQICRYRYAFGDSDANAFVTQLLWWSIPALLVFGRAILGAEVDKGLLYISAFGLVFLSFISAVHVQKQIRLNSLAVGLTLFAVLLVALIPLELALVSGRLNTLDLGVAFGLEHYLKISYLLIGVGFIGALIAYAVYADRFVRALPYALLVGQLGLPLLYTCFYPAKVVQPDGAIFSYVPSMGLVLLLAGIAGWAVVDVLRRYSSFMGSSREDLVSLLSPIALFALLMVFKAGTTYVPQVSSDDYHFGEHLLGWWSYLQGVIPYVGYMPAHGIIGDDLPGLLAYYLYDGKAASVVEASRLATLLLSLFAFLSIYRFSGSVGYAFIAILFLGGFSQSTNLAWLFLTPFLCLWLSKRLLGNPARWLAVWMVSAPVVILGVPPQGTLLVAASGIVALYMTWKYLQINDLWHGRKEIGLTLIVLLLAVLFTPVISMLFSAIRYVLENGPLNQVAYGIPWKVSWHEGSQLILELVRTSWVIVPIVCVVLIWKQYKKVGGDRSLLLPAAVALLFCLLLIPYSMGRIDPGTGSRLAAAGVLAWTVLLPLALWRVIHPQNRIALVLLAAVIGGALNISSLSVASFVSNMSMTVKAGHLKNGESIGLPNLGVGEIRDDHWDRLTRLHNLLNRKLAPGENYLDLTSRNAQYFYLDRMPLQVITAPYNLVPRAQQLRAVERLQQEMPRIALLEGSNITHDGGGLALRSPILYRFVMDNYIPSYEDGFIIGYRKSDYHVDPHSVQLPISGLTDLNWNKGINRNEAALVLALPEFTSLLKVGQIVRLANGETREIVRVWETGNAIWLDGAVLDSDITLRDGIEVILDARQLFEYRGALFHRAFSVSDFGFVPVAWGRSEESLLSKMSFVSSLPFNVSHAHDVLEQDDGFQVVGGDPYVNINIEGLRISGQRAGLLKFDFYCVGLREKPRIQIFWWGGEVPGPAENFSVKFNAANGTLIVPLDALPRWLMLDRIKVLRFDLDNASACTKIEFKDVALYQRVFD